MSYKIPLLLTFNRPDFVKKQVTSLRRLQPKNIYIFRWYKNSQEDSLLVSNADKFWIMKLIGNA